MVTFRPISQTPSPNREFTMRSNPITDALNSVSPHQAGVVAFEALTRLQIHSPADQIAGIALLYAALVKRYRVDPRSALEAADRRLADALDPTINRKPGDQVRALREYMRNEL